MTELRGAATMKTFAFIVHPRAEVAADMGRRWAPLGAVPDAAWEWAMGRLPLPTIPWGDVRVRATGDVVGHILTVPLGARQMLTSRRAWTIGKIERAVDRAERLGAEVVGLGALTAPVTGGGRKLRQRDGLGITNGNAFTAAMTHQGILRLLPLLPANPHIAFVGATGSVGGCVVRLAVEDDLAAEVTLVARNRRRLNELRDAVRARRPATAVHATVDIDDIRHADLVVVMTSSATALVTADHLKPGAIVLDDTQPRNTDPAILDQRPDVLVVDGGMARVEGLEVRADVGVPQGYAYACLCETMLLALADHRGNFCTDGATVAQARHMQRLADDFSHLGFQLGEFLSFGQPVRDSRLTATGPALPPVSLTPVARATIPSLAEVA